MNKLLKLCAVLLLLPSINTFSATKICEFNDPVTGTTPGCTQHSIGGYGYTVAYNTYKDGKLLVPVWRTINPYQNSCSMGIAVQESNYNISYSHLNNCSNYRIYNDWVSGKIQPKYKVLSVIYAPPGTQGGGSGSSVTYGSSSSIGSTFSASKSFKHDFSVTVKNEVDALGSGGSISTTFGKSRSSSSNESLEVKKTASTQISYPGTAVDGVDHNRDLILLWLGPIVELSMTPTAGEWTIDDTALMDLQYVYVGHLKNPSLMPPGVVDRLEAYGITPDDYDEILKADPLADASTPLDTERYQQLYMTFPYQPPYSPSDPVPTQTFAASYSDNGSFSNSVTNEYFTEFKINTGADFAGFVKTTFSVDSRWTWTDTDTRSNSSGTSESASVTIGGPSYGYTGPTDMGVYYDVIYKTFAFVPINPGQQAALQGTITSRSGKAMNGKEVVVTVDGVDYRTFTNTNGEYRIYGNISSAAAPQFRVDGIKMQPVSAIQTNMAPPSGGMNFTLP